MNDINTAKASIKLLPISDYKLRLLARFIQGKPVALAERHLMFSTKKFAEHLRQLLLSCIANAKNNNGLDVSRLVVDKVMVGKALVLRRFTARGRGRSSRIEKRYSNVTLIVRQSDENDVVSNKVKK
jgi:large subunit ribosomal protein L22